LPENAAQSVIVQVTQSAETAGLTYLGAALPSATSIEIAGALGSEIKSFASGATIQDIATAINTVTAATGVSAVVSAAGGGALLLNSVEFGSDQFVSVKTLAGSFIASAVGAAVDDFGVDVAAFVNGQRANAVGLRIDARSIGLDTRLYLTPEFAQQISSTQYQITDGGALFQITSEVTTNGQVNIGLDSVSTGNLGNAVIGFLSSLKSGGANEVRTQNFVTAERILREAINQIATQRGRLGGVQRNQIETNINSQQIQLENVQSSESIIRDADMATEVAALTRAQILVQSTQLTLQVANQQPQAVLQLLG
jgi:flagellin-like hook-associated protein FlgL